MTGGMGPRALVLLHGFTGAPASWDDVRDRLQPATPALAPALLGHDGSPGDARVDTFSAEVDRLAGMVRSWIAEDPGPRREPRLVGYSLGGRVALGLLIGHPALFGSAVLIGASPGPGREAERQVRRERDEEWARLLDAEGLSTFVAAWERLPLFVTQARLPESALATQRRVRRSHDPRGLARSLRVLGLGAMPDYRGELETIDLPVRLVVGEGDEKFRRLAEEMGRVIPRAEVRVVAQAGHNVVLERPEDVARILEESD